YGQIKSGQPGRAIGYYYLAGQQTDEGMVTEWVGDTGTLPWFFRGKLAGAYRSAPILTDKIQSLGPKATSIYDPRLEWTMDYNGNKKMYTSVHRGARGVAEGGNFAFEDGH